MYTAKTDAATHTHFQGTRRKNKKKMPIVVDEQTLQDLLDAQAAEFMTQIFNLTERVSRLERIASSSSAQQQIIISHEAPSSDATVTIRRRDTPEGGGDGSSSSSICSGTHHYYHHQQLTTRQRPSIQSITTPSPAPTACPLLYQSVLNRVLGSDHSTPHTPSFLSMLMSVCKRMKLHVETSVAMWTEVVGQGCGEEYMVSSIPAYVPNSHNRPYLCRLQLQPWTSIPLQLYSFVDLSQFIMGLDTKPNAATLDVSYVDRIGVITSTLDSPYYHSIAAKRNTNNNNSNKAQGGGGGGGQQQQQVSCTTRTRLVFLLIMRKQTMSRTTTARITLSTPLALSAKSYKTPDIIKQSEFIPWPKEYAYSELKRTTETYITRLRAKQTLPTQVWEAFQQTDASTDRCGLGFSKLHKNAFALFGLNEGSSCPIFIFSSDCTRLLARLPIFHGFPQTRLFAYGSFLFQTTRDGIGCYGPRPDGAFRRGDNVVTGKDKRIRWLHEEIDDDCDPENGELRGTYIAAQK